MDMQHAEALKEMSKAGSTEVEYVTDPLPPPTSCSVFEAGMDYVRGISIPDKDRAAIKDLGFRIQTHVGHCEEKRHACDYLHIWGEDEDTVFLKDGKPLHLIGTRGKIQIVWNLKDHRDPRVPRISIIGGIYDVDKRRKLARVPQELVMVDGEMLQRLSDGCIKQENYDPYLFSDPIGGETEQVYGVGKYHRASESELGKYILENSFNAKSARS